MIVEIDNTTLKKEFLATVKSVTGFFDLTSDNEDENENEELEPITVDSIPGLAELIKYFEMIPTEVIPTEIIDLDSDDETETETEATVNEEIEISENLEAMQIVTENVTEKVMETELPVSVVEEPPVSVSINENEEVAISEPSPCITTTEEVEPINEVIESIEEEKEVEINVSNTIENIPSLSVKEIIEDFATSEGTTSEGENLPEDSDVINDEIVVEENNQIQELIQDTDSLEINDTPPPIEQIDLIESTEIVENLVTETELETPEVVVTPPPPKKSIGSVIFSMQPKKMKSVKYNIPDVLEESSVKENSSVVYSVYKNNKALSRSSVPQEHFKKSVFKQKTINCTETSSSASKKGVKFNKETIASSDDSPDDNEFVHNRRKSTILEKISYVKNITSNTDVQSLSGTDPLVLSLDDNINKLSVCDFSTILNKNSCESDNNNLLTDTALNPKQSRCTVRSDLIDTQKTRNYSENNFFSNINVPSFNVNNFTDRQTPTDSSPDLSHYINEQSYKREGETSLPFKKRRKISCYNEEFDIKNETASYKPPSTPPILSEDKTKTEPNPLIILNENDELAYPAHTMISIASLDFCNVGYSPPTEINDMPTYDYLQPPPQNNNPSDGFGQQTRLSHNPDPTNNLEQQHQNNQNDLNVNYNITSCPTVINVPPHSIQYTTTYEPTEYRNYKYMLNFNHYHVNEHHIENYIHNSKKNMKFKYNLGPSMFIQHPPIHNPPQQTMQSSPIVTSPYQMHEPINYSGEPKSNLNEMNYECNVSGCKCNIQDRSRTLRQRDNKSASARITRSSNRTGCVHVIEDDKILIKTKKGRGRGEGVKGRGRGRPRGGAKK